MSDKTLQSFNIYQFQEHLIDWFVDQQRDLPWRKNKDPYKVWVSEIMLQQTKVDTVIPYFHHFMKKFPTVHDLAMAEEQEVLKAWEGLGYYSRARNLHQAAKDVVEKYDGVIPSNPKELGALKGIGPYTKGAILSIAFMQEEPAVDGNVMRVLSRLLKIEDDIARPKTRKRFEQIVRDMISGANPSHFNQALMELGALICTPKSPTCLLCPVMEHCRAFHSGVEETLPIKSKAKKPKLETFVVLLIKDKDHTYMIEQRPTDGLLANLWQFPMVPLKEVGLENLELWFFTEYGFHISLQDQIGERRHVFTHLIWDLKIYEARVSGKMEGKKDFIFVESEALHTYPFPVSHKKIMEYIEQDD
ncbi:A/G-specific adenine glycosylase [Virgibacillus soli]|uniref:Adenine DNA glycosylase n=1 Tax=Paracerasibacillus soli TaxID=480284 RepID=A0ABU5CMG0_9BACI|nr:A/G-specific adenine glycosylase [Virgibacillus soli]MDY0407557.1 A/G-specific adenine glycosylase [Virgibacillus soli]